MKAVLFDVDGTLVKLRGAGRAALIAAIAELFGLEQERVQAEVARIDFRGATDRRIVGTLMELLQLDGDARVHHVFERYVLRLQQTVHERGGELLPGVDGLVRLLEQRADVIVGLLTGN
ncbi:MAG: HAD family hydrolase, partial [Acidobacteriota bacterium]